MKQNACMSLTGDFLSLIHTYIHRVSTISEFLCSFDTQNHYLYSCLLMCLTVRRSSSRGWAEMQISPDDSSLNLIGTQVSKHCRNSSVRAVRLCEKCGEIVSRRMEHSIGSQSPKTQKTSRKGGLLLPCARTPYSTRHLSVKFSYPHILQAEQFFR